MELNNLKKYFIFLLLPTFIGLWMTKDLPQNNKESLFLNKSQQHSYFQFKEIFGSSDQLVIELPVLQKMTDNDIENNYKKIRQTLDQFEIVNVLDVYQATHKKTRKEWTEYYQSHPLLDLKLYHEDGLLILAQLSDFSDQKQQELFYALKGLNLDLKLAGMSYTNFELNEISQSIPKTVFPILFLLTMLFCWLYYRDWILSSFILLNSLLATVIGLIVLKLFYNEANMLTTSVPVINFVTSQSLSFHLIHGLLTYGTIQETYKKKLLPISLMAFSTIVGLLSLVTSDILVVKQFAISSALALTLTTVFFLGFWWVYFQNMKFSNRTWRNIVIGYRPQWMKATPALFISLLLIVSGVLLYSKLSLTVEALYFFSKDHQIVQSFEKIEKQVGGTTKLDIVFRKKDKTPFLYQELFEMGELEKKLVQRINQNQIDAKIVSKFQLISMANYLYTGELKLPEAEIAGQALYSQVPNLFREGYADSDHYRMSLNTPTHQTEVYQRMLKLIEQELESQDKYEVSFNGLYYTLYESQKNLIHTLVWSLTSSFLIVSLIIGISLRSLRSFWHFFLVNTAPLGAIVLFLYFFKIALNVATVKTFSIAFGIMVDSTIHLLYRDQEEKHDDFVSSTLIPIYLCAFVTILSFLFFGFHSFLPIKQFGLLLEGILFLGLIFDMVFLPALERFKE